jgi:hypothetical protein
MRGSPRHVRKKRHSSGQQQKSSRGCESPSLLAMIMQDTANRVNCRVSSLHSSLTSVKSGHGRASSPPSAAAGGLFASLAALSGTSDDDDEGIVPRTGVNHRLLTNQVVMDNKAHHRRVHVNDGFEGIDALSDYSGELT